MKKRLLSLVLCLVMVFSLFPAFAAPARAVTGNDLAADGTYTVIAATEGTATTGKATWSYRGTQTATCTFTPRYRVSITVSGGKITNISAVVLTGVGNAASVSGDSHYTVSTTSNNGGSGRDNAITNSITNARNSATTEADTAISSFNSLKNGTVEATLQNVQNFIPSSTNTNTTAIKNALIEAIQSADSQLREGEDYIYTPVTMPQGGWKTDSNYGAEQLYAMNNGAFVPVMVNSGTIYGEATDASGNEKTAWTAQEAREAYLRYGNSLLYLNGSAYEDVCVSQEVRYYYKDTTGGGNKVINLSTGDGIYHSLWSGNNYASGFYMRDPSDTVIDWHEVLYTENGHLNLNEWGYYYTFYYYTNVLTGTPITASSSAIVGSTSGSGANQIKYLNNYESLDVWGAFGGYTEGSYNHIAGDGFLYEAYDATNKYNYMFTDSRVLASQAPNSDESENFSGNLYYAENGTIKLTDASGALLQHSEQSTVKGDVLYTGALYTRSIGVKGDLTGYKSLEDNRNGTYKLNIDSWATGAAQGYTSETSGGGSGGDEIETIITEQVEQPLDIVLVIDQSGSMKTADMGSVTADSYQLVNHTGAWTEAELNDGTVYYVKDKSGNYHRLERETGNVFEEAGAVRGNKMFGYGHDGFSVFFNGAPVHFNVKTPYYIKGADGEMHRLFMVTAGLDLEYGLYPYIYNNNDDAYAQKSEWTWLDNFLWLALVAPWGVKRLQNNDDWAKIINKNGSDGISWVNTNGQPLSSSNSDGDSVKLVYRRALGITITNASYIRNLYTVADQGVTGLYYTASDGTKVPVSNTRTMGDENFTISTDTTDGNLYVVHTTTTRVDALQYAANEFVKDIAENSTEHAKHRIAVVGFAGNKTPALSSGWTAYSTPRADGSFNGSTKYDYTNTGLFLPGANGSSSFVNYGTIGSYDKPSAIYSNVHYYINGTDDVKTPIVNRYNRWYNLETGTQTTATSSFLEPKHTWLSANQYQSALVTVKQDNDAKNYLNPVANGVNDSIDDIIANLGAYGGTYTSYGLAMANQIFANATENTGLKTTTTVVKVNGVEDPEQSSVVPETLPAKHVIVFFTDGEPGAYGFESAIANEALAGGVQSKMTSVSGADGYDATVYTVGLYPGSVSRQVENFMHQLSSEYTAQLQPVDATSDLAVKTTLDSSKTYYYQDATGKFYSATTFYNDESSLGWWRHNADGSYSPLTVVGRNGGGVDEIYSDQACTKQVDGEDADTSATYYNNGRPVRYEYRWYNSDRLVVEPELGTNESLPGASTRRYQFFEISGQTSNSDGAQYYYRASDVSSLNTAFESIANSIKTQATTTGGDASAVQPIVVTTTPVSYNGDNSQVIDYVSPAFEVPEGATVEVQIVESTGLNADSTFEAVNGKTYEKPFVGSATTVISATTDASADGTFDGKTIHMDRSGKTVKVTGFDFSKYYISSNHPGKFLRVVINGLEPNGTGELFSNTTKSGIYNKEAEPGMLFQYNNPSIEVKTFKVLWQNGEDVLETDSGLTYADQLSYDGETPSKPDETVDNGNNTKTVTTYQFVGWSTNENAAYNDDDAVLTPAEIAAGIPVTGDQTYYAIFKPEQTLVQNNYTVQWHSSNSAQNPIHTDTEVAAGTYPSNLTAVAAPSGQLFVGWTTDAHYQPTYNDDGTVETFPDNYFVTRTNLPVEYYDKDDGAEDGVVKFYAVFVNAGKLSVAPDRTVIAEYSVQSQIETGVYDFDGRSANGSFTKTLDGEANERGTLYFTFNGIAKSGSIASGYDLTPLSQVSKATYYTGAPADSNLDRTVTTVTVIPGSSVYLDDSLTGKSTGAADAGGTFDYTSEVLNGANVDDTAEAEQGRMTFTFTGYRADFYCTTTEEGKTVRAYITDSAGNVKQTLSIKNQSAEERYNVPTVSFVMDQVDTYTVTFVDIYGDYKLDGVRVYNNVSELADTAEANAHYIKLRDKLVEDFLPKIESYNAAMEAFEKGEIEEAPAPLENVAYYSDTNTGSYSIAKYVQDGPKNEIYLAQNDAIAFMVNGIGEYPSNAKFYVGLSVQRGGDDATVQLNGKQDQHVKAVTDAYYEVAVARGNETDAGIVYIKNLSSVRVAVTNLKVVGADDATIAKANAAETNYAKTLAVAEETVQPKLIVNSRLLSFVEHPEFTEAAPESTPDPTPDPTQHSDIHDLIYRLISAFVQNLFKSIAKLFGN